MKKIPFRKLDKNLEVNAVAHELIAHGALTNSKRPASFVAGVYPTHLTRSFGAKVVDVDGNEYVDYTCALGTNLLGYNDTKIRSAIADQLWQGISFPLGTRLETELARDIANLFPHVEKMRFLKTGSEACSAAIRIARAFTKREMVASEGYHGWLDEFVSLTRPASGVPLQTGTQIHSLSDLYKPDHVPGKTADELFMQLACIIIEPVVTDASEIRIQYLHKLREMCDLTGALLIFDETITALRFPGLSVARHIGVRPDITVFGKALGGGLPLAVVGGCRAVMETDYFVSSTFAGETLSLAAARAVLDEVKRPEFMDRLWAAGKRFQDEFNAIQPGLVRIEGYPTRGVFRSRDELTLGLFFQEACKAGILFGSTFFYCVAHEEYDRNVLSTCANILRRISHGEVELEGQLPVKPYAQTARDGA